MNKLKPAEFDVMALEIIRSGVDYMSKVAARHCNHEGSIVLDIAPQGKDYAKKLFNLAKYETLDKDKGAIVNYHFDLCGKMSRLLYNRFDAILCFEVLEHTENPFKVRDNLNCMIKRGGLLYLTTPFNFRIHGPLPDNWRFTEHGLKQLFSKEEGWEIIELTPVNTIDRNLMPIQYRLIAQKL